VKVAYIAGPFRAQTYWGIVQNVRHAERIALKYWKLGYAVICPHTNTANFDGAIPKEQDSVWLDGDIEIMKRCDVVIAMSTWQKSTGASAEVALALSLGIEVIYDNEEEEFSLTPPKPQRKQTDFNVAEFDSDSTGYK
jgi:nucleoside 2-deoxyribosyltransferase